MPSCFICGENLEAGARTCSMCGTGVTEASAATPPPAASAPAEASGFRSCPACNKNFTPEYADSFCTCGVELIAAVVAADVKPGPVGVPPGTPCLVLYGADRKPVHYFPLAKDATLIGRLDAVSGTFPDIDMTDCLEPGVARKVSRKHALVLRSRQTKRFSIRPLAGNTGTQIEDDMVMPMQDYPLKPGTRLILGGAVRLKFEIT